MHEFGADRIPGEFVFVPAGPKAEEDEGWLVGLVINTANDTMARVELLRRIKVTDLQVDMSDASALWHTRPGSRARPYQPCAVDAFVAHHDCTACRHSASGRST